MLADSEPHRKLAAILSADAVGYSRLMQADEPATLATLNGYRAAMRRVIERHKGRVVNAPGDALLAEFTSVVEAVAAAVEVQQDLEGRNLELAPERRMHFRIGVNLGDVIEQDDGTIYGDGVNIAARMEALAQAGGVCLSGMAHDHVENKLPFAYVDLGEQTLKNIAKPVRAYRIVLGEAVAQTGSAMPTPRSTGESTMNAVVALASGPSIAVLPFASFNAEPGEDYFADGIAEEIITQLTRFRELFVIARNSTFRYKGQAVDIKRIGAELGVRYVLEGSLRKAGGRVRVTAQLIEVGSAVHLWAETYDREFTAASMFAVQDEITEQVVAKIAEPFGVISRAGLKGARGKAPGSLSSYECVLLAREYYGTETSRALHLRARDALERAVSVDPGYADAWAWLSILYVDEHRIGYNPRPGPPALDRALVAARQAVGVDPASAIAHWALACAYYHRHDRESFAVEAEQALALGPGNALILAEMGQFFILMRQGERGMALTRKAIALNPVHPGWYWWNVSNYHYDRREYAEALAATLRWNDPDVFWCQVHLARAYGQLGRYEEAQHAIHRLLELYPDYATNARAEERKWTKHEDFVEHEVEGLRKAGLNIPPP
jgi:adenylate cyclase